MFQRFFGILKCWYASENGGWGYILTAKGEKYFVHRKFIKSGQPLPGSSCIFTPQLPLNDKLLPQAFQVVINSNTTAARTSTFPKDFKVAKPNGGAS